MYGVTASDAERQVQYAPNELGDEGVEQALPLVQWTCEKQSSAAERMCSDVGPETTGGARISACCVYVVLTGTTNARFLVGTSNK